MNTIKGKTTLRSFLSLSVCRKRTIRDAWSKKASATPMKYVNSITTLIWVDRSLKLSKRRRSKLREEIADSASFTSMSSKMASSRKCLSTTLNLWKKHTSNLKKARIRNVRTISLTKWLTLTWSTWVTRESLRRITSYADKRSRSNWDQLTNGSLSKLHVIQILYGTISAKYSHFCTKLSICWWTLFCTV